MAQIQEIQNLRIEKCFWSIHGIEINVWSETKY